MLRRLLLLLLLAVFLLIPAAGHATGVVFPRGSRIGLEPTLGLKLSQHFPGFEDAERQVKVTILDLPATFYNKLMRAAFAKDQKGLTIVSRGLFPFAGGLGILVTGHKQAKETSLYQWFLVARPIASNVKHFSTMISVQVPAAARSVYTDAVVRKMLASVNFRPTPIKELVSMLPFQLTNMAGFRVIQVLPVGAIVLSNAAGNNLSKQTYVIVSLGRGAPSDPDERARFARNLVEAAPLRDLTITSLERMRINGLPGVEVRANGSNRGGKPVSLVQWLRFGTTGFLRMVAITPRAEWSTMFNRFRALRDGIKPR